MPLTDKPAFDINRLQEELNKATRNGGANAYRLFRYHRALVDMLTPPAVDDAQHTTDRAIITEELIRQAIDRIAEPDPTAAEAVTILLGLQHDSRDRPTLHNRRQAAGRLYRVTGDTFRKTHEDVLFGMLAFEIIRIRSREESKRSE